MVYRDLNFGAIYTLKHAVMVCRSPSEQTLYVSTPFLPGATNPTFTQALLSQIVSAYQTYSARSSSTTISDQLREGTTVEKRDQGSTGNHARPASGTKRKIGEYESGPSKKTRLDVICNDDEIPTATLSSTEQLDLSEVRIFPPNSGFRI
jgi:hypothetical protein